jgi:MoaA/NifB/PqqE/SkfB family radical SAM enzyme
MKPEKDNTFCYFPFSQLALKDWDAGHGIVNAAPCCNLARREDDTLKLKSKLARRTDITPEQVFQCKAMNKLRDDMLNGVKNPICNYCWKKEKVNKENTWSPRLYSYKPDPEDFDHTNPRLQAIDFGLGENCNLRCRMCSPALSNKLRIDQKYAFESDFKFVSGNATVGFHAEGKQPESTKSKTCHTDTLYFESNSAAWQWVLDNISQLKMIRATGGEVFVERAYIELLDKAISENVAKDITLHFHTNATKFSKSMINRLKEFKQVEPIFSIDSVGKNYEYIRHPMSWDKLEESVKLFIDQLHEKSYNFGNNIAYSSLNAHYIEELYDWLVETIYSSNKHHKLTTINISDVIPVGKGTNIAQLPLSMRHDIIALLRKVKEKNQRHELVILNDIDQAIALYKSTKKQDYNRSQSALRFYEEVFFFDCSRKQSYRDYLHADICEFLDEGKKVYEARKG